MPAAIKSVEERIAILDQKIEKKKAELASLEAQKQKLLRPINMRAVLSKAKEIGLTPEDVARKLGIEV